jgi:hypothetical protein
MLLVTTPDYVLKYCTETRQTWVLETGRPEYFGASWFAGDDAILLSHSGLDNNGLETAMDYMLSEVGFLSSGANTSERFLSIPHQIRCLERDLVAVTNTGRNCLSIVDRTDWSVRQYRFNDVLWDRYGSSDDSGNHFNSIEFSNGRIYLLAHNFKKGSFTLEVEWPSMAVVKTTHHQSSGMHNIWIRDDGSQIACDTMNNSLVELVSGETLWQTESTSLTRGLAATVDRIFVGGFEYSTRELRTKSETGIWEIDASTMKSIDYHWMGAYGCIHEIRVLDELDLCHPVGLLSPSAYAGGVLVQDYWKSLRLLNAQKRVDASRDWQVTGGDFEIKASGDFVFVGKRLSIALYRHRPENLTFVSALLRLADCKSGDHCGLVVGHVGPSSDNMFALIFLKGENEHNSVGFWACQDGEWSCLKSIDKFGREAAIALSIQDGKVVISLDGRDVGLSDLMPVDVFRLGGVGMRGTGGAVANLRFS